MLLKNPLAGLPLLEIPGPWRRGTRPLPALARPCQTLPTCQTSRKNHGGNESMEELCREWGGPRCPGAHAVPMLRPCCQCCHLLPKPHEQASRRLR